MDDDPFAEPTPRPSIEPRGLAADRIARGDHWDHPMDAGKYAAGDPRNDPEYEAYCTRVDAILESEVGTVRRFAANPDAPDDELRYEVDRLRVHAAIVDELFEHDYAQVPNERKAWVMGGLPGSGKSRFLEDNGDQIGLVLDGDGEPANAVVVNPDEIKKVLLNRTWGDYLGPDHPRADEPLVPRVDGLRKDEHAALCHEESSTISKAVAARAARDGKNVVFDITLGDSEKTRRKYLSNESGTGVRDNGYRSVTAVYVDAEPEVAMHSAGMRHKRPDKATGTRGYTGRYVPFSLLAGIARRPGGRNAHGGVASSQNRLEFDEMVAAGDFDAAKVYYRSTNETRDA